MNSILSTISSFFQAVVKLHPQMPIILCEQIKTMHAFIKNYEDKQFFLIENFVKRLTARSYENITSNNAIKPVEIQVHSHKYMLNRARTEADIFVDYNKENQKNRANFLNLNYTQPLFKVQNPNKYLDNTSITNMVQSKSNKSLDKIRSKMHKIESVFFKDLQPSLQKTKNCQKYRKQQQSTLNVTQMLKSLSSITAIMDKNNLELQNIQKYVIDSTESTYQNYFECNVQSFQQKILLRSQSTEYEQKNEQILPQQKPNKKKKLRINFKTQASQSNKENQIISSV